MLNRFLLYLKSLDWLLFSSAFILSLFGLLEIYSVALGQGERNLLNFNKQSLFILISVLAFFVFVFIDYRWLKSIRKYLFAFAILSLSLLFILGTVVKGTRGWFQLHYFAFQPVELVKVILIIFLAGYFSSLATKIKTLKHFLISLLSSSVLFLLVLYQPDFGSAVILIALWLFMLIISGFPKKYWLNTILISAFLFSFAWVFLFKDYQINRIKTFINPSENTLSESYNITQAMIAIGSGSISGRGMGLGSQSQLKFLPEAQTDFIFSVIAEEMGFLGVSLILFFYILFFYRIFNAIKYLKDDFSIYVLLGSAGLIFIQMFINIGMNIGLLPIVGLSLPFISYGGSSIISLFILLGILENIIIKAKINY